MLMLLSLRCPKGTMVSSGLSRVSLNAVRSIIEVIAEAMTLAEKNGIQRQSVVQFIETLFPGHIFKGTAAGPYSSLYKLLQEYSALHLLANPLA